MYLHWSLNFNCLIREIMLVSQECNSFRSSNKNIIFNHSVKRWGICGRYLTIFFINLENVFYSFDIFRLCRLGWGRILHRDIRIVLIRLHLFYIDGEKKTKYCFRKKNNYAIFPTSYNVFQCGIKFSKYLYHVTHKYTKGSGPYKHVAGPDTTKRYTH